MKFTFNISPEKWKEFIGAFYREQLFYIDIYGKSGKYESDMNFLNNTILISGQGAIILSTNGDSDILSGSSKVTIWGSEAEKRLSYIICYLNENINIKCNYI